MTEQVNEVSVCWRNNQPELICLLKRIKITGYSGYWPPSIGLAQKWSFFHYLDIFWIPFGWLKIVLISGKITVFWIPQLRKQITNCLGSSESVWLPNIDPENSYSLEFQIEKYVEASLEGLSIFCVVSQGWNSASLACEETGTVSGHHIWWLNDHILSASRVTTYVLSTLVTLSICFLTGPLISALSISRSTQKPLMAHGNFWETHLETIWQDLCFLGD